MRRVPLLPHAEDMTTTLRSRFTVLAPVAAVAAIAAMTLSVSSTSASEPTDATASARLTPSRLVHIDPAHDVRRAVLDDDTMIKAPARADVDIRKVVVRHDATRVVSTFTTRRAFPSRRAAVIETIRTLKANFDVFSGNVFGDYELSIRRGAQEVRCPGLRVRK